MINARDTVIFSIGGQIFVTRRANLYRLPESRLYMLAVQNACCNEEEPLNSLNHNSAHNLDLTSSTMEQLNKQPIYYFDRDPEIFRFVLDYYRTGELHLPSGICGPFVRKELIFWGIDESYILPCCMPAYMRYEEERRTKRTLFRDCFEDQDSIKNLLKCCRGFKKLRYQLWLFLDHPGSSLAAKSWALLLLVLMIASVMCFCLSTHEIFRFPSGNREIDNESMRNNNYSLEYFNNFHNSTFCSSGRMNKNPKLKKDCTTQPAWGLVLTDIMLNLLFTMEFLFKVLLAPDKKKFLTSLISQFDMIILCSYWAYISVFYYHLNQKHYTTSHNDDSGSVRLWFMNILSMTQVLRIMRIFRISKISRGLQVLILTVKKSIPELVLLAFLLMNGMFLFSALIYMAEYQQKDTFPDIPQGFWWSIITLTTVGYGDFYPKSGYGYFIGSVAAICGCIVTGLAIPIIGNNFNTYYKYMQNQLKEDKYIRQLRKDLNDVTSSSTKSYGNSPCPGMFRDHSNTQSKMRRLRKVNSNSTVKSEPTPNGFVKKKRFNESSNESHLLRSLPKLKIPHSKVSKPSPTPSRNEQSGETEMTELLTPYKKSSEKSSEKKVSDLESFDEAEISHYHLCLPDNSNSKQRIISSSAESMTENISLLTENDRDIVSPTVRKYSMNNSHIYSHSKHFKEDYV